MRVKYTAADATVTTHENTKDPEGAAWTASPSGAVGLTVTESRRRGVLGRRSATTTTNGNDGGHDEQ